MKVFITGGSGFIGKHVLRILKQRGYPVKALVRSQQSAAIVQSLGAEPVWGDITEKESMRADMQDHDVVIHLAGWYKLGARDQWLAEITNVDGTQNVLSLAHEIGIPKIIYTSSVAVFGDTRGYLPDETFVGMGEPFLTEYDRTKWKAHFQIARPMIEMDAPIIILLPGVVYGPGDHSLIGDFMKAFLMGLFPVLPGPELTLTLAHVEDVAEAHVLAAEKGVVGETYLINGMMQNLGGIVELWAKLSGKRAPLIQIPANTIKPLRPIVGAISRLIPLPPLVSEDTLSILGATYIANSEKARQQLGWEPRPLEEGMRQTIEETAKITPKIQLPTRIKSRRGIAAIALGAGIGLLAAWLLSRKRLDN